MLNKKRIIKKCQTCNNDFEIYAYRTNTAKFCSITCMNLSMKGKHFSTETEFKKGCKPINYKGIHLNSVGRFILALNGKTRYAYRYIVERLLGRKLEATEHIHHKDNNKQNDLLDNFMIFSNGGHRKFHSKAYDYLVEKGLIEDYMQWFELKYTKLWKTVPELIEGGDAIC